MCVNRAGRSVVGDWPARVIPEVTVHVPTLEHPCQPLAGCRFVPALLVCAALAACKTAPPPPVVPPAVVVEPVEVRDTPVQAEFTGQVRGGEDVEVRARVAGFLESMHYREGSQVKKGQLLFVIDSKPFEATAARARADLAEAKAQHNRTVIQVNRLKPLAAQNAVSQQDLDNALASEEASRAAVVAAEAQLTSAEFDLGYTRVTSPITGTAGNRMVDVGSFVGSPQPTVLTVVSSLDTVRFDFTISGERVPGARSGGGGGGPLGPEERVPAGARPRRWLGPPQEGTSHCRWTGGER